MDISFPSFSLGDLYVRPPVSPGTSAPSSPALSPQAGHLRKEKEAPLLGPNPFGPQEHIRALNLAQGPSLPWWFCPPRLLRSPGIPSAALPQTHVAERLNDELGNMKTKPRAVVVCPHHEPLIPTLMAQHQLGLILEVLAFHQVQAWISTRGFLRPCLWDTLARFGSSVKIRVGLTTLDRSLQQILEPGGSSPERRLKTLRRLLSLGINPQVALEPLFPGLTDTRENLVPLMEALQDMGIRQISAGYLFLANGSEEYWQARLGPRDWDALVLDAYTEPASHRHGPMAGARFLPKPRRQRGYAALISLAANYGIQVSLSATSNPDFHQPKANSDTYQPRFSFLPPSRAIR